MNDALNTEAAMKTTTTNHAGIITVRIDGRRAGTIVPMRSDCWMVTTGSLWNESFRSYEAALAAIN